MVMADLIMKKCLDCIVRIVGLTIRSVLNSLLVNALAAESDNRCLTKHLLKLE